MIRLQNLTLQRGPQRLLEGAELTLYPGQKAGLVGANGAGKSSLFALLRGELTPDGGDSQMPPDWRIAHMRQEVDTLERLAVDYVLDGDETLRRVQAQLVAAEQEHDGVALARLHSELDSADGYTADARARKLLAGLGFSNEQMELAVGSFSGGWRMRLNLAQALMCPSDLLLLDEPTNHLDLDAILWLEDWLKSYPGTLILISHDRDFLDAVVDHVVHLEQRKLTLYRGGYSAFERTRAERLAQQQQAFEKQQAQRAHMESFIRRFKAKATKARQAQSRIKALEKLEELAPAHIDSPFDFSFREADKVSSPLLDLSEGTLGYPGKRVLDKVKLQLVPGARIGLLGPNGAGKSTLIKTLAAELQPLGGHLPAARRSSAAWREPGDWLLRPAPARCAGPQGQPLAALAAHRRRRARTDAARFSRRLRFSRRPLRRAGAELFRRREGAPGPGADRLGQAEPAAAR